MFYDDDSKSFKPTQYWSGDEPYFMNLLVRFSDDPYLTYMEETDGTGKFGLDSGGKIKLGVSYLSWELSFACWRSTSSNKSGVS